MKSKLIKYTEKTEQRLKLLAVKKEMSLTKYIEYVLDEHVKN